MAQAVTSQLYTILVTFAAGSPLFMMKFLYRSRSKAVDQNLEKAPPAPNSTSSTNELKKAKEQISELELKLQQRNNISTKELEDIVQFEPKSKERDSDLSSAQTEKKSLEDRAQKIEDQVRCSKDETQTLRNILRQRDAQLLSAKNEITGAKELVWKERKASLFTQNLLAQAERDLIRAPTEQDRRELEMLAISNQVMRQQLEDANTQAELDRKKFKEEQRIMENILSTSQKEFEEQRTETKQYKLEVSILDPLVKTLEQQLKMSRAKEERMSKKCNNLEQHFLKKLESRKQRLWRRTYHVKSSCRKVWPRRQRNLSKNKAEMKNLKKWGLKVKPWCSN